MKTAKKIFLSAISTLLIATTIFGSATYASNDIPEGSSPESIRKFNEYIASLSGEQAQSILEDRELVINMKLDSYWEVPDRNSIATQLQYAYPIDNYPAGQYYTQDGQACTCHTIYDNYCEYNSVYSRFRCRNAVTGTIGNCRVYVPTKSIQCKAFADYVYKYTTKHEVGAAYAIDVSNYSSISNNSNGAKKMKSFFESVPSGTNVRFVVRHSDGSISYHSIIAAGMDSDHTGIYVYDANWTGICQIGYKFRTWKFLAEKFSKIQYAWLPTYVPT